MPVIPTPTENKTEPIKPANPVKPVEPKPQPPAKEDQHNGLLDLFYYKDWLFFKTILNALGVTLDDFITVFVDIKNVLGSIVYVFATWFVHSLISIPLGVIYPYMAIQFFIGDNTNWKREALQNGIDSDDVQSQMFFYVRYLSMTSVAIVKGFDKNEIMKNPKNEDTQVIAWELIL